MSVNMDKLQLDRPCLSESKIKNKKWNIGLERPSFSSILKLVHNTCNKTIKCTRRVIKQNLLIFYDNVIHFYCSEFAIKKNLNRCVINADVNAKVNFKYNYYNFYFFSISLFLNNDNSAHCSKRILEIQLRDL